MLRYKTITSPDINNGIGCRMTIWICGCKHNCPGCHNKELQNYNQGEPLYNDEVLKSIIKELEEKPYLRGITFSGGDPLSQDKESLKELNEIIYVLKNLTNREFDIWIYTGDVINQLVFYDNDIYSKILRQCDVLVDGPYIQQLRDITLPFRGSKNQRLIDLKKSFEKLKIVLLDIDEINS